MREWDGTCRSCGRRWRLQLEPRSEDLEASMLTLRCPGGDGGSVVLTETRLSQRHREILARGPADA